MTGNSLEKNDRILVRPVNESDIYALVAARTGEKANRYTGWECSDTKAWAEKIVAEMASKKPGEVGLSGTWYQYAIVERSSGETVGDIGVGYDIPGLRQAEIGYRILEEFQGRGIAADAVGIMIEHLFKDRDLHRLVAYVATQNQSSSRLLEALGFRREGEMRKSFLCHGEWMDEYAYGLLAEEWRTRPGHK